MRGEEEGSESSVVITVAGRGENDKNNYHLTWPLDQDQLTPTQSSLSYSTREISQDKSTEEQMFNWDCSKYFSICHQIFPLPLAEYKY